MPTHRPICVNVEVVSGSFRPDENNPSRFIGSIDIRTRKDIGRLHGYLKRLGKNCCVVIYDVRVTHLESGTIHVLPPMWIGNPEDKKAVFEYIQKLFLGH